MGFLGWGETDSSTSQERKDWRDNAQKQIDQQNGKDQQDDGDDTPRHRRARRPS